MSGKDGFEAAATAAAEQCGSGRAPDGKPGGVMGEGRDLRASVAGMLAGEDVGGGEAKRQEWSEYIAQVHEWELQRYLGTI